MKKGKSGNMKKVLACVVAGMMIFQTGCSNAGNKGEPAESSVNSEEKTDSTQDNAAGNSSDGNAEGNADGSADGNAKGNADGNADGNAEDNADASTEGNASAEDSLKVPAANIDIELDSSVTDSEMVKRSLVSIGNTARLQRVFDKINNGEKITVSYLGGSITQGMNATKSELCYAGVSSAWLDEVFAKNNSASGVNYVNAGIPGTPSTLGLLRSTKQLLFEDTKSGESLEPDIVFIEFAVNDGTDPQSKAMYESLVRKTLSREKHPAVILIFTVLENGYSAQDHMKEIGEHYDVGMISVKDAITPEIEAGRMNFSGDYASDEAHPNNVGHALIADFIKYYFDNASERIGEKPEEEIPQLPEKWKYGFYYSGIKNIELAEIENGSFERKDIDCFTYKEGYVHEKTGNEPMTFTGDFSKLLIAYRQYKNENYGAAEVIIDGKHKCNLEGYSADGWGNVATELVLNDVAKKEHTVEIKMKEGDEEKEFVLLDIGVCE
ncbi:MAG: hypothetical protein K6F97_06485 [Lachnospiraceae bacterium]|nr:hypothetical protein [Lachnospiraceae bacterium]